MKGSASAHPLWTLEAAENHAANEVSIVANRPPIGAKANGSVRTRPSHSVAARDIRIVASIVRRAIFGAM